MTLLRRLVVALIAASVVVAVPIALGAGGDRQATVDLQVAVRQAGRCGTYAQELPPLVIASGFQPGDVTPTVEVCLRNKGSSAGFLVGRIVERLETEIDCTADEPAVDPTCTPGAAGELGLVLRVVGALRSGCSGAASPFVSASFDALAQAAVPITELRKNAETCVLLRLEYPSATDTTDVAAAQTDRLTWRYAFDLSD
jgi:hypothetical protein